MLKIKGLHKEKLDYKIFKKGDILSFEGPFLSHFYDENGNDYLMLWVDNNTKVNRWLLFKTEKEKLFKYLSREISLKKLFTISKYEIIYFIDLDNEGECNKCILTIKEHVPKSYLPKASSYFEEDYADQYGLLIKQELSTAISEEVKAQQEKLKKNASSVDSNKRDLYAIAANTTTEIIALKFTHYAVLVHFDKYRASNFQYLISIHNSAYTNHLNFDLYFTELNRALGENNSYIIPNIYSIIEKLIISTIEIVNNNPAKYMEGFKTWRNEILSLPNIPSNITTKLNSYRPNDL